MHEPGLRERKRAATRKAIQLAVLELSIAKGFEHVTIDDIGRAADVSPRTFFNYFASKEDAVTGGSDGFAPSEALVQQFLQGDGTVLDDLVELMIEVMPEADDFDVHRLRRKLMKREPSLLVRQVANAHVFEEALNSLVAQRLRLRSTAADDEGSANGRAAREQSLLEQARLLSLITVAIARHGWTRWVSADGRRSLPDSMRQSHLDFRATFSHPDVSRDPDAQLPQLVAGHVR